MSPAYQTCTDWARQHKTGNPNADALLKILALDIDTGLNGSTRARLANRVNMSQAASTTAINQLLDTDLIERIGSHQGTPIYAPRWQS